MHAALISTLGEIAHWNHNAVVFLDLAIQEVLRIQTSILQQLEFLLNALVDRLRFASV